MITDKCFHIVGGGLVGSLLAVRLRQAGYKVKIFEKRPDVRKKIQDGGRSINLILTSRGMHSLKEAGLMEDAQKLSVPVFGRMIHSKTGDQVYQPYGQNQECNLSISRLELNKFLLEAAEKSGAEIFFSHDVTGVDLEKKQMTFSHQNSNSKTESYDFVFATDGSGSLLRKTFVEKIPKATSNTDWLPVDYKELTLPLPTANRDDFFKKYQKDALHIWPRGSHMMMALSNLDGSFTLTLYLPRSRFAELTDANQITDFFKSEFPDAIGDMPNFLNEFQKNPQGTLGTTKLNQWTDGKSILLLGDAAHAITPFFGQGTNLGFEDVSTFMDVLKKNDFDVTASITALANIQKPNADAIADMAVENWYEMSERVGDPRFLLRKKAEAELERRFPEQFKSRYGMVTYTLLPYSKVYELGKQQEKFFGEFLQGVDSNDGVQNLPWSKAEAWLATSYGKQ